MKSKISVNGFYELVLSMTCEVGQEYNISQIINEFPYKMDFAYFKLVKPIPMVRTWFTPTNSRDTNFDFGIILKFLLGENEVADQGLNHVQTYSESESFSMPDYTEITHFIKDFHSFEFDAIK